jgi:D-galactarolactone cycloisomerase
LGANCHPTHNPLRDDLLSDKFVLKHGALLVPQGPGLGVNVNDDMLAKYSAKR